MSSKLKKISILLFLFVCMSILLTNTHAFANINIEQNAEYTEEFKQWLELPTEEREKVIQPRMYYILPTNAPSNNILYKARMLRASISSKYNLKDVIPGNLSIRNQKQTNSCWTFAALSSLETNLAMANYKKGTNISNVYDYSERHMEYATSKTFANNIENKKGYNRSVGSGGNWYFVQSYLTNGTGAINESEMPFENNENIIDISAIQNKTVSSQVYDTVEFADYSNQSDEKKLEIMNQIKEHIQNYGSVFASIHGNSSVSAFECHNNATGAKYCNNSVLHKPDHAVSIVGWDDNYSISNFAENVRPSSNGAWIIRNSWGERDEHNLSELKEEIFNEFEQQCIAKGWNSASEIPNEFIEEAGFTIEGDIAYIPIDDNGFMYVSYEDCNISKSLFGIVKATDTINYENIYQYDEYSPVLELPLNKSNIVLCNLFDKKSNGPEYITEVSLYAPETYTCKVYVNPNGTSKSINDMQLVELKSGISETFNAGYHTLEFSKPIEIKGSSFAIAIEIEGSRSSELIISAENKVDKLEDFNSVTVETGKCFVDSAIDFEENINGWIDLKDIGDSSIKAFTVSRVSDEYINNNEEENNTTEEPSTNEDENQTSEEPSTADNSEDKPSANNENAENSNFDNASCKVNSSKYYTYSDPQKQEYMVMNVTVDGISKNNNNDKYEYYYYLSSNQGENNIEDWIKITENQTYNDKLQFEINTKDVKNYDELSDSNSLYLYIKEVAIKGENQAVKLSNALTLNSNDVTIETYLDNVKVDTANLKANTNNETNTDSSDKTVASGILPNTGIRNLLIFIFVIGVIGLVIHIKYKNLSKYVK